MNDNLVVWVVFKELVFGQLEYVKLNTAGFHLQNLPKTQMPRNAVQNTTKFHHIYIFFFNKDFIYHEFNGKQLKHHVNSPINKLLFFPPKSLHIHMMSSKVGLNMNLSDQLILQDKIYSIQIQIQQHLKIKRIIFLI